MRIITKKIPPNYVYPCSRRDVRDIFGTELLKSVWFGMWPEFQFDSRAYPRPHISGVVAASMTVSRSNEAMLLFYRIAREEYSDYLRFRVREMLGGLVLEWTRNQMARSETEILGNEELIVEIRDGLLVTHEMRYL